MTDYKKERLYNLPGETKACFWIGSIWKASPISCVYCQRKTVLCNQAQKTKVNIPLLFLKAEKDLAHQQKNMHCTLEVISRMQGSFSKSVKQQINNINVSQCTNRKTFPRIIYKIKVKKKQKQIDWRDGGSQAFGVLLRVLSSCQNLLARPVQSWGDFHY